MRQELFDGCALLSIGRLAFPRQAPVAPLGQRGSD